MFLIYINLDFSRKKVREKRRNIKKRYLKTQKEKVKERIQLQRKMRYTIFLNNRLNLNKV